MICAKRKRSEKREESKANSKVTKQFTSGRINMVAQQRRNTFYLFPRIHHHANEVQPVQARQESKISSHGYLSKVRDDYPAAKTG